MIDYAIFGEFFQNGESVLSYPFRSSYLFPTPQSDLKETTHQNHDDMYNSWKKISVLRTHLSIPISTFQF